MVNQSAYLAAGVEVKCEAPPLQLVVVVMVVVARQRCSGHARLLAEAMDACIWGAMFDRLGRRELLRWVSQWIDGSIGQARHAWKAGLRRSSSATRGLEILSEGPGPHGHHKIDKLVDESDAVD